MTFVKSAMGAGTPAQQARSLIGAATAALTATGTTQADALLISASNNEFTTVASGTGCILTSSAEPGDWQTVYNYGANALLVYPPVGGSISNGAANAGFSVAANKSAKFTLLSATRWGQALSA